MMLKQSMAWIMFLQSDHFIKNKLRAYHNIDPNQSLGPMNLIVATLFVTFICTLGIVPFDNIKTHMQKKYRPESKSLTILKKFGFRGLFKGWRVM